jgi:hypothetical protein
LLVSNHEGHAGLIGAKGFFLVERPDRQRWKPRPDDIDQGMATSWMTQAMHMLWAGKSRLLGQMLKASSTAFAVSQRFADQLSSGWLCSCSGQAQLHPFGD